MLHPYTCPTTTVPIVPGSFLDLQSHAAAAGFRGLRLVQPQAQYPPPQSSATPAPIPIEGIPGLQTWVTRFTQWTEENRAFFKASPHWTHTTTSQSRQHHTCNAQSPNPSSMPFSLTTSPYTSFSPWWLVLVCRLWIPLPFSKTGKVPSR